MDATVVGIDVSKDRLDVHVHPAGENFAVARTAEGLDALIARLAPLGVHAVAVEATGGFESVVVASLGGAGLPVIVVNPAQVRAFAQALGNGFHFREFRHGHASASGGTRLANGARCWFG